MSQGLTWGSVYFDAFANDPHGCRCLRVLGAHQSAAESLFAAVDEGAARLVVAEELGHPALAGIVRQLELNPEIAAVLALAGDDSWRFRQATGVAARLKMEELGWATTGRKGSARGRVFVKAERYSRANATAGHGLGH